MSQQLAVRNLCVRYGAAIALHGVSFDVATGECVAVVGANGAGKSTLGKAIARLVPATGEVRYGGRELPRDAVRAGVVYVPEGRMVFPQMTVEDNLRVGAFAVRRAFDWRERRDVVFERMPRLAERARVRAGLLSGGEQQLLAIARALMARPSLLVLDEPSLGLSPAAVRSVSEFLAELGREFSVTTIVLEQNTAFAARIADRGVLLRLGEVVESRLSKEELADPRRLQQKADGQP
ncbi:ABC transporter ATP-binding protein [Thermobifida alba]|uniref:ABC transporter ATP-binding protein n=1 Tax=Thermobifida alba TaxID=53522 RepID=A0ABY4KYJ8_THEAE|nr:ABC transporter ATP-binding protein [Thermobifida alba]UPT20518.1 ABC transporter ATP-binding protein [Thermobifida alba]